MRTDNLKNKAICLQILVSIVCILSLSGCEHDETKAPVIISIAPVSGTPGTRVTITGSNFSTDVAANSITFNGSPAAMESASGTQLVCMVPANATSGKISVTTHGMTGMSNVDFTVIPAPVLTFFAPASGSPGTNVTITGSNFSPHVDENVIKIHDILATVVSASATQLVCSVPLAATSGKITVVTNGVTVTSTEDFIVLAPPTIAGFTPASALPGKTVTITGANFGPSASNNVVKFNGVVAQVLEAASTSITCRVPSEATSGKITVSSNGVMVTSSDDFRVTPYPVISAVSPAHGVPGDVVTITGLNLLGENMPGTAKAYTISIHSVEVAVQAGATQEQIQIIVPSGSTTGRISIDDNELGELVLSTSDFEVLRDFPRSGLVAFYPFTGNANDHSGNGINGTEVNAPALVNDRFGMSGQAYAFNGTNNYIDFGAPSALNFGGQMTLSLWVKGDASGPFGGVIMCNEMRSSNSFLSGYYLQWSSASQLRLECGLVNPATGGGNTLDTSLGNSTVSFQNWDHVVLVFDHKNWSFYSNGVLINQGTINNGATDVIQQQPTPGRMFIGALNGFSVTQLFFKGSVDDVMIYDRPVSQDEVQKLYRQTATKY